MDIFIWLMRNQSDKTTPVAQFSSSRLWNTRNAPTKLKFDKIRLKLINSALI